MDTTKFLIRLFFYVLCLIAHCVNSRNFPLPKGHVKHDWFRSAQDELRSSLRMEHNTNIAKNVIIFIGDGMGFSSVWASRIYTGQYKYGVSGEEYDFHFEKFPHVGIAKTYNVDFQIPDSAGTATAILSGVKVNAWTVGVNDNVKRSNCSNQAENHIHSILKWSQDAGKSTGIVTTTRVTHATPSAAYAHAAERFWESDHDMNKSRARIEPAYNFGFGCKDIARQLVEDNPEINVVMGGGRRNFRSKEYPDEETREPSRRDDGRDLIQDWLDEKRQRNVPHSYVWNKKALEAVDTSKDEYLLGLFEPNHMNYESDRNTHTDPSLPEMTAKAIEVLQKDKDGFFLLVEGGKIDHAHHDGHARLALDETWSMDRAVKKALEMTNSEETLIVVTADHSHSFISAGYTSRGHDILDHADNIYLSMPRDIPHWMPYTTLQYANGPGAKKNDTRQDITGQNTTTFEYKQQSLVPMNSETHSGEDVPIYAVGPMAHLFHGVHEQHYIAHVMAYASCVGQNQKHCSNHDHSYTANLGANNSGNKVSSFHAFSSISFLCICALIFSHFL